MSAAESRQLHTTAAAAAVAPPNHSTVMLWVCVRTPLHVRRLSERVLSSEGYRRPFAINSFCSQAFIFC